MFFCEHLQEWDLPRERVLFQYEGVLGNRPDDTQSEPHAQQVFCNIDEEFSYSPHKRTNLEMEGLIPRQTQQLVEEEILVDDS